jgi:hypothetical protein
MKTTSPIISELQSQAFAETSTAYVNGVDFNFQGHELDEDSTQESDFVLNGVEAVRNRVLFWLTSAQGDYVREPSKGGLLYQLLGTTLTDSNLAAIEQEIEIFFSTNFSGELTLLKAYIVADVEQHQWVIKLYVQDPILRELFETAVAVAM